MLKNKWSRGAIGVAAALALGLSIASPANAVLGTPNADFPSSTTTPGSSSSKTVGGKVKFTGTAGNSNYRYYLYESNYSIPRPSIQKRNKGVKASNVAAPYLNSASSALAPNVNNTISLSVYRYTTPGQYRIKVPVTERRYTGSGYVSQTKTDRTELININANPLTSKSLTSFSGYSNRDRSFNMTVRAPDYQRGASIRVYYKKSGSSSYKKVATKSLKTSSYNSRASFKISKSYKLRPGGSIYVKIGSVTYAPSYKTGSAKIKAY